MTLLGRFGIYSVIGVISLMPLLVLPAMIGTLADESTLGETLAGWSASLNFFGGAVAALLMALRMHRLDLRRVAVLAFAAAALGDLTSAFSANVEVIAEIQCKESLDRPSLLQQVVDVSVYN